MDCRQGVARVAQRQPLPRSFGMPVSRLGAGCRSWRGIADEALQLVMLMQSDGERIVLLPAWPKEWNAEFKLHAPGQVVVQGTVRRRQGGRD